MKQFNYSKIHKIGGYTEDFDTVKHFYQLQMLAIGLIMINKDTKFLSLHKKCFHKITGTSNIGLIYKNNNDL